MGKVKDGVRRRRRPSPRRGNPRGGRRRPFCPVPSNLAGPILQAEARVYARLYTALGLGVVLVLGVWRLHEPGSSSTGDPVRRSGRGRGGARLVIFRLVEYPPFVEFLIATEAEMNKVSWTSRDDLYRATTVVLTTVLLMAVFLSEWTGSGAACSSSSACFSSAAVSPLARRPVSRRSASSRRRSWARWPHGDWGGRTGRDRDLVDSQDLFDLRSPDSPGA